MAAKKKTAWSARAAVKPRLVLGRPLLEAIAESWSELFPGAPPMAEAIPLWVRDALIGVGNPLMSAEEKVAPLPGDIASRLRVAMSRTHIAIGLEAAAGAAAIDIGSYSLFAIGVWPAYWANWAERHPIADFVNSPIPRLSNENVIWLIGFLLARIDARTQDAVRERLFDGRWILSGASSNDPAGGPADIPIDRLRDGLLDLRSNEVTFPRTFAPKFVNVRVRSVAPPPPVPPPSQSFEKDDEPLIDEMRQQLVSEKAPSVIQAARNVAPKARRKNTKKESDPLRLDSVVERLRRGYARKYP